MAGTGNTRSATTRASQDGAGPVEHVAEVAGSRLHYWTYHADPAGRRPTVLFVHGFRGTHHGLELIARALPGHQVVVPDLPGFGASSPMTGREHDVAGYADALIQLVRTRFRSPIVLCGHSFGSVVAARMAAAEPALFRRLVLINAIASPALGGPKSVTSQLAIAYYKLGEKLPERSARALLASDLVVRITGETLLTSRDPEIRRFVHESHRRHFSAFRSRTHLFEAFRASISSTVADYAADLPMPTLLIAGEADGLAPLTGQREVCARLADGRLVTIPGVGHLVHYEAPAAAAAAITDFLVRPDSAESAAPATDPTGEESA